jgi:hypothetical protein
MKDNQIDWELDQHKADEELASGLDEEDMEAAAEFLDNLVKNGYPEEGTGMFPVRYIN